jgi:hypothetical protein
MLEWEEKMCAAVAALSFHDIKDPVVSKHVFVDNSYLELPGSALCVSTRVPFLFHRESVQIKHMYPPTKFTARGRALLIPHSSVLPEVLALLQNQAVATGLNNITPAALPAGNTFGRPHKHHFLPNMWTTATLVVCRSNVHLLEWADACAREGLRAVIINNKRTHEHVTLRIIQDIDVVLTTSLFLCGTNYLRYMRRASAWKHFPDGNYGMSAQAIEQYTKCHDMLHQELSDTSIRLHDVWWGRVLCVYTTLPGPAAASPNQRVFSLRTCPMDQETRVLYRSLTTPCMWVVACPMRQRFSKNSVLSLLVWSKETSRELNYKWSAGFLHHVTERLVLAVNDQQLLVQDQANLVTQAQETFLARCVSGTLAADTAPLFINNILTPHELEVAAWEQLKHTQRWQWRWNRVLDQTILMPAFFQKVLVGRQGVCANAKMINTKDSNAHQLAMNWLQQVYTALTASALGELKMAETTARVAHDMPELREEAIQAGVVNQRRVTMLEHASKYAVNTSLKTVFDAPENFHCPVCLCTMNELSPQPRLLMMVVPCGHLVCGACAARLRVTQKLKCATCGAEYASSHVLLLNSADTPDLTSDRLPHRKGTKMSKMLEILTHAIGERKLSLVYINTHDIAREIINELVSLRDFAGQRRLKVIDIGWGGNNTVNYRTLREKNVDVVVLTGCSSWDLSTLLDAVDCIIFMHPPMLLNYTAFEINTLRVYEILSCVNTTRRQAEQLMGNRARLEVHWLFYEFKEDLLMYRSTSWKLSWLLDSVVNICSGQNQNAVASVDAAGSGVEIGVEV